MPENITQRASSARMAQKMSNSGGDDQSPQSLAELLRALQSRPYEGIEAVSELELAISKMQEMERSLKDSTEYRAHVAQMQREAEQSRAQETQSAKLKRMRQLEAMIEGSRKGAEQMLGFRLTEAHFSSGCVYWLLHVGYVDQAMFDATVSQMQVDVNVEQANVEKVRRSMGTSVYCTQRGTACYEEERRKRMGVHLLAMEDRVHAAQSRLLWYLMNNRPMVACKDFKAKIAAYLDAMLDALLELRMLEGHHHQAHETTPLREAPAHHERM